MIHMERRRLLSDDGDSQYNYQVHLIDNEDKLTQLIALEQQLELTEKRFRRLQNYVEYIRTLYHGSLQDPSSLQMSNHPITKNGIPLGVGNIMHIPPDFNTYMFEEETFQGGGDDLIENGDVETNTFLFEPKDEIHKKKKASRKKSPKKVKTPSKKTFLEDPSQRLIDRKTRLKTEKSMATIKVPRRNSAAFSSSYLKPTVASTMKKMRPHHPNFNFRSIPFVAGKATTRSHNLGIKIQETLSIIKRNTPAEVGRCTTDQASGEPAAAPNSFKEETEDTTPMSIPPDQNAQ